MDSQIVRRVDAATTALAPSIDRARGRRILESRRRGVVGDPTSAWEMLALRQRVSAGLWSARVALVLSVPFALAAWGMGVESAWLTFMLLPTIAAFFAGGLFGAAIADRYLVPDEPLAARRGALVGIATYAFFAMEVGAMSATPLETGLDMFMGSMMVSGWFALPAAFFAGIMAFRAREGALRHSTPPPA